MRFTIWCRDERASDPHRKVGWRGRSAWNKSIETAIAYALEWAKWYPRASRIWITEGPWRPLPIWQFVRERQ